MCVCRSSLKRDQVLELRVALNNPPRPFCASLPNSISISWSTWDSLTDAAENKKGKKLFTHRTKLTFPGLIDQWWFFPTKKLFWGQEFDSTFSSSSPAPPSYLGAFNYRLWFEKSPSCKWPLHRDGMSSFLSFASGVGSSVVVRAIFPAF